MASLDDILSAVQNLNKQLSNLSQAWARGLGNVTTAVISAQTLVTASPGYLVSVIILDDGSAAGSVNNAATVAAVDAAANLLYVIPTGTNGVFPVGAVFNKGLVVTPGTGQVLAVTYFQG